ncbi:MAG: uridine kinase [Candidatus Promineifilaceae bacterium]
MNKPIVFGVAGGTASGKTTAADEILRVIGAEHISFLPHDAYYRHNIHLNLEQRTQVNYDHPDSLETELLVQHVVQLLNGEVIERPVYDFVNHLRSAETVTVQPQSIILVEGILIFAEPALRALMNIKLFVDTDADVRFIRRMSRDVNERGRSLDSVIDQYLTTVRPMHLEFVEPSKRYADVIVPEGGLNKVAIDMVVSRLLALL